MTQPFGYQKAIGCDAQGRVMVETTPVPTLIVRVPVCKNALMTVSTDDTSMARYGEHTTFFLCVLPYKEGYQIDIYSTFTRVSGGFTPQEIGTAVGRSLVGDSSQLIPRTMYSVRTAAESVGGKVTVVDRYIPDDFKGAFTSQANAAGK